MPSGSIVIDEHRIKEISTLTIAEVVAFLLTSQASIKQIIAQHKKVNT